VNANLRERFERLEPREQKLVLGMGAVLVAMVVLLVPIVLAATASSKRKENDATRDVMAAITSARSELELQNAKRNKVLARYARPAPPLAGLLEQLATAHSIEIPESQDRPAVPHANKRYEERSTKIELQKVGMKNLSTFLESVETSGLPVRVSGLNIRKRAAENDSWDVSLTVSAFDRKESEKKAAPSPSGESAGEEPK
jgi:general secretion pathway protein M